MTRGLLGFTERTVQTSDGLSLAVFEHVPEPASADAPAILLVNGLGGNLNTWRHLIQALAPRHRIVTWDYRGLHASRFAHDTRAAAMRGEVRLDVGAHAADALRVMDAVGLPRAVLIGWSMGVQLNFELARLARERVAGLIQICGAAGRSIATTVLGKPGLKLIPPIMDLMRAATLRHGSWLARAASSPAALQVVKLLGAVAPSLDERLAADVVRDFVRLDFDVYNKILMSLGDHDATDVLPTLAVPTLVVAGTRDAMTPLAVSELMARQIPGAELVVMQGGSHYLPIEFPDALNQAVLRFLSQIGSPGS